MNLLNGFWKKEKKMIGFCIVNIFIFGVIGTAFFWSIRATAQPIIVAELKNSFDSIHTAAQKDSLIIAYKRLDAVDKKQDETLYKVNAIDGKLDVILRVLVKR